MENGHYVFFIKSTIAIFLLLSVKENDSVFSSLAF